MTSGAVLTAAEKAFAEAGLAVEAPEEVVGEDETAECDVAVIGMGASGTFAAVSAAENGAKAIVKCNAGTLENHILWPAALLKF